MLSCSISFWHFLRLFGFYCERNMKSHSIITNNKQGHFEKEIKDVCTLTFYIFYIIQLEVIMGNSRSTSRLEEENLQMIEEETGCKFFM